jgi:teichuronic acid biosynthesis glycosyltransferase TuaG
MTIVSIVMPTYNSEKFVREAIDSVRAQTFDDWELIIVDDASIDETLKIIQSTYAKDPRVKILTQDFNQGAAIARNKAIAEARGRFIAFLDSDDLWRPQKLEIQVSLLMESDACMAFSKYDIFTSDSHSSESLTPALRTVYVPARLEYKDLLAGSPVGCLTAIYDTKKTGKVFMPEIRMRQDWGLWLRLLRGDRFGIGVQQSLAALRLHPSSLSANKIRATYFNYKLLRTEAQLGPLRAAYGVGSHALTALKRRIL